MVTMRLLRRCTPRNDREGVTTEPAPRNDRDYHRSKTEIIKISNGQKEVLSYVRD